MSKPEPVSMFLSYAHEDELLLQKLVVHLSGLKRQGLITTWYDHQIAAGTAWAQTIDTHLEQASVILLLVSPDFLASDYCYEIEVQRALQRHQTNEARVIPIVLRPCDWSHTPFALLQGLPRESKPVTEWSNQDAAWTDVVTGIRRVIEELSPLSVNPSPAGLPPVETSQGKAISPNATVINLEEAYFNKMDNMKASLLKKNLLGQRNEAVVNRARVLILRILPSSDKAQKRQILLYLYESKLIEKDKPVINLARADLSEAHLSEALLSGATLSGADLSRALLSGAHLIGANLSRANLSGALLSDTKVTEAQLKRAKSLEGATMPDGTVHP